MKRQFVYRFRILFIWIGTIIIVEIGIRSLLLNFSEKGRAGGASRISQLDSLNVRKIAFWPALYARKPVVRGDICYLSAGGKLQVLDISNPFKPRLLGETVADTIAPSYRNFVVRGNYAYVRDIHHGLRIFDLSTFPTPREVGIWEKKYGSWRLDVAKGYAFFPAGEEGLFILDVRDPYYPKEIYHLPYAGRGGVKEARVYGDYLYVGTFDSLLIFDISDVTHPSRISGFAFWPYHDTFSNIRVVGTYAYICARDFHVIDVSDPYQPVEVASHRGRWEWGGHTKWDIFIEEDYAYIADEKSLWVVDVHDPHSPITVGYYDTELGLYSALYGVYVAGDYIYAAGSTDEVGGLYILEFMGNIGRGVTVPNKVTILQNYPNPFQLRTRISYALPQMAKAKLSVYNLLGQQVYASETEVKTAGYHTLFWDAGDLPSGVYFCRISARGQSAVSKVILIR